MSDELLNDNLVPYLEQDLFENVLDKDIARQFQTMRPRRHGLE